MTVECVRQACKDCFEAHKETAVDSRALPQANLSLPRRARMTASFAVRYLPFGLQRPYILLCVAVLAATLSGCKSWIRPGTDVPQSLNATPPFAQGSAVLLPGADYHLVTVRRPVSSQDDILCSEPSPDWAIAFGTALAGAASGGASGGPSGSISGSASTTEAITPAGGPGAVPPVWSRCATGCIRPARPMQIS